MSVKLLISAEANAGKTTLTKNLEDTLVISCDGKRYPFPTPHVLISEFADATSLINTITEKIEAYHTKFNKYPKTVVFDSVSKIFEILYHNCNEKYTGFTIYSKLDGEVNLFNNFIERSLIASDLNVVLISHATYDADSAKYSLVGKGAFQKKGGYLSEVDEGLFIEVKGNKRIIHFRSGKFPARSLQSDLPESTPIEEFDLQKHIEFLQTDASSVEEFAL
jgi:hypothetical protein